MADLAALASVHKKEVSVKPLGSTNTVLHKLWLATAPMTIGYYFNNMLRESMLPECQRGQLSSGTASNECLNAEINGVFRNVNGMYQATLKLECEAFKYLKLLAHSSAEYMPADYNATQDAYVNHVVSQLAFSFAEWDTIKASEQQLFAERCAQKEQITRKKPKAKSRRRPGLVKRHSFNKRRIPVT